MRRRRKEAKGDLRDVSSRIVVKAIIEATTGLHIGSGVSSLDPSATDSPVIRDGGGRPFIPGSSFKGASRAHIERIVRGLNNPHLKSCDPLADPCLTTDIYKCIKLEATKGATADGELDRSLFDSLITDKIVSRSCDVCRLFGSNYLSSHLLIKDLFIVPESWFNRTEIRDGVGIDRDTETARTSIKYDFEVLPSASRFSLQVAAENADATSMGLLALLIGELERGRIALGGKTTRGLGGVRLILGEISVTGDGDADDIAGDGSTDVLDYLLSGSGKRLLAKQSAEYLERKSAALAATLRN